MNTFVIGEVLMKPRTVRLPEDLDLIIMDTANKMGVTEAELIREVLSEYFCIRHEKTSIETLIRGIVKEELADSTSRAPPERRPISPDSTSRAPTRTLEAPHRGAPTEHPSSTSKDPTALSEHLLSTSGDPVASAMAYILDELKSGREPLASEVAEKVGMDSKRLGTLLGRAGIKAKSVHRGGKKARRYLPDLRERIEELLEG